MFLLPFLEYNFHSFQSRKMSMTTVIVFLYYIYIILLYIAIYIYYYYILPAFGVLRARYTNLISTFVIPSCFCIICMRYVVMRSHLKRSSQVFGCNQRRNMERNIKLSKTLFMVIAQRMCVLFQSF